MAINETVTPCHYSDSGLTTTNNIFGIIIFVFWLFAFFIGHDWRKKSLEHFKLNRISGPGGQEHSIHSHPLSVPKADNVPVVAVKTANKQGVSDDTGDGEAQEGNRTVSFGVGSVRREKALGDSQDAAPHDGNESEHSAVDKNR